MSSQARPEWTPGARNALTGGGEMGALMRAHDWAATPLGPVAAWPQSLSTAVSICLTSRFPLLVWWGPRLIKLYNDAYQPILGAKHPRALGQPGRECWPEIWDIIGPMLEGVLTRGESTWSHDQLLLLERNGYPEECYFTFSYSPIRDESGGIGGVFTAVSETTQRVLGERRLRTLRDLASGSGAAQTAEEAGALAAAVLAGNPDDLPFALLYLIDAGGETARLVGTAGLAPSTEAAPERVDLRAPQDGTGAWPLAAVATTGTARAVDDLAARFGRLPTPAGTLEPHTAFIMPVARPGLEQIAGLLVVGLSPRRALDDDYRGFLELVAGQIATALATARALHEARAQAQALAEIDQAKTRFFSNVSHEFRTPLTLLLGPLEDTLNAGALAPADQEHLAIAHRNALRLLKLVNTLLDFSRIEAGRFQAEYEPVDLAELTVDLTSTFRAAVERAGLRLLVRCPPLPEPVYVDREMWEKIVFNLLSNAFKFTFAGEIAVHLGTAGDQVQLSVRDTGTGIPEEELPHVFERFHRVRGAQARTYEGTGIGLALVQELVRMHGGTIEVTSRTGTGTTFTVRLPRGHAHLAADRLSAARPLRNALLSAMPYLAEATRWISDTPAETESPLDVDLPAPGVVRAAAAGPATESTAHILLADDNADMRDYLYRLLRAYWSVEAVADGAAALAAAQTRVPDLVLSDVMMPGRDGFALLRALRGDPRTQTVPVILLSGRAGEEATVEGLAAGADDYLTKPFSAAELLARVRAHLDMARVRAEALAAVQDALNTRDQFLSIAAHELKTPLTSLLGYAQVLQRRAARDNELSARDARAISVIVEQARRLSRLIDSLLHLSRIQMGQFSIESQRMDLAALVRRVTEELQPGLERHTLALAGADAPILIDGDDMRLEQVVQNLLQNAVKYSPNGGVIEITLTQPGTTGCLVVSDSGIGIPPGERARLFQPFYRASNAGGGPISGMGIGLYVVKEIVALHGGTVAVESTEGQGSTFTVCLPLAAPAPAAAGPSPAGPDRR